MGVRMETARFHIATGPDALFERVQFKFNGPRQLKLHGKHFKERLAERKIPEALLPELCLFDSHSWHLKTAEVRQDTGKFINVTWEKQCHDQAYWVTIGFGDVIVTIITKDSDGVNDQIITSGPLYELVTRVNRELMDGEDRVHEQK